MPNETFAPGLPVEIGKIDRELKHLWEQTGGDSARASLINFAIYSEAPDSLGKNTALLSALTENHACRGIVVAAEPGAAESKVDAWISAHCHVSRAGRKQICSEQLSFSLKGELAALLPNIVFAQLDSDLPLCLWWQEEFRAPMDAQLWAWVDRVIYDSQCWKNFDEQMRFVETAQHEARQRIVLCDLNWVRLVQFRIALAQFFDHPCTHHHLDELTSVAIEYAPGFRSTALLFVGWLAAQLGWKRSADSGDSLGFEKQEKDRTRAIKASLIERPGAALGSVTVQSETAEFHVEQKSDADLLELSFGRSGGRHMEQVLPASKGDDLSLLQEELMRGGPHRVYLGAVAQVRDLI